MVAGSQPNPSAATAETLKFVCSYDGKILLRHTDGELRYVDGHTRVLAVAPSISFSELTAKLTEFCGQALTLRCQLPNGDWETLITIRSEEELAYLIEEHTRAKSYKIKAILSPPKPSKPASPAQSATCTSGDGSPAKSLYSDFDSPPKRFYSPTALVFPRGTVCYYPCHVQRTPCEIPYKHHRYHHHHHQFQLPRCN